MSEKRKCCVCGKEYEWCMKCNSNKPGESWKFLYHDKNCLQIANILRLYRGKAISKDEAKSKMDEYSESITMALKYDSIMAKEVQEIYNSNKNKSEEIADDNKDDVIEENKFDDQTIKKTTVKQTTSIKKQTAIKKYSTTGQSETKPGKHGVYKDKNLKK